MTSHTNHPYTEVGDFVLVTPYRFTARGRNTAAGFMEAWYGEQHNLRTFYGDCEGEWSKGAALDAALQNANPLATGLIIADADVLVAPAALARACAEVEHGAPWAMPHSMVHRLSRASTMRIYAGRVVMPPEQGGIALERPPHHAPVGGGIVVVPRAHYELVRGIDPRFIGWGGEDISFGRALDTLCGPGFRGDAPMWHLWHEPDPTRLRGGRALRGNEELAAQYLAAWGDPDAMRAVLAGR